MKIDRANLADALSLARLLWLLTYEAEPQDTEMKVFGDELMAWWRENQDSFAAFVARDEDTDGVVGMAWVALAPRTPRPGKPRRVTGDIQSVYVLSDYRGRGLGGAVVKAATEFAEGQGAGCVTVASRPAAVSMYERLGFASTPLLLER